jgi:chromosome segregation ATPase
VKGNLKIVKSEIKGPRIPDEWLDQDVLEREWNQRLNAKKEQPAAIKTEIITMNLAHRYTDRELKDISEEWVAKDRQKVDLEMKVESLKSDCKQINSSIEKLEQEISDLAAKYRLGVDYRDVKVEKRLQNNIVEYFRMDTGELFKSAPFKADEMTAWMQGGKK